jgi:transposase
MINLSAYRHAVKSFLDRSEMLELTKDARQRLLWFLYYIDHKCNVSLTCRYYGIARSTFLRWAERFDPQNPQSLEEYSRRPKVLRQPQTPLEAIAFIKEYREHEPRLSKEVIAGRLLSEHGMKISSATVGRVIQRYGFFYATSPAHESKRRSAPAYVVIEKDISEGNRASEGMGGLSIAPVIGTFLAACAVALGGFFAAAPTLYAAESTSYQVNADPGNNADGSSVVGSSYQIDSVSLTWRAMTGESDSYSEGAADDGGSDSGGAGVGGGTGGGSQSSDANVGSHRGHGTNVTGVPTRSEVPSALPVPVLESPRPAPDHPAAPAAEITVEPQPPYVLDVPPFALKPVPAWRFRSCNDFALIDPQVPAMDRAPVDSPWLLLAAHRLLFGLLVFVLGVNILLLIAIRRVKVIYKPLSRLRWLWLSIALFSRSKNERTSPRTRMVSAHRKRASRKSKNYRFIALLIIFVLTAVPLMKAEATTTVPQNIIYNGQLKNSSGVAITTNHIMRFSFWNTSDAVSSDINGDGSINTLSSTYAGWNEYQTVIPNSSGYFAVKLGSSTALPSFSSLSLTDLLNLHMQVEVKQVGAADTTYEILDVDTTNSAVDRSPVRSVPFALNADLIDQRDVGTGSGNIAILGPGGVFDSSLVPGGTNSGTFVIDRDGSSSSTALQFGSSVARQLSFDGVNSRFNFSDDVRIAGDLTVTGLINGIDISTLNIAQNTQLKVSSGAGLTVTVAAGGYRLNGSTTHYAGNSGIAVQNNATNYVFFGSGGLSVSTIGFPTDESAIRIAQVATSGGAISSVTDKRVLQEDDRENTLEQYFNPAFEKAVFQGDATTNIGQLSMSHDSSNQKNFYLWASTKAVLQDYDIILRVPLSSDFVGWVDNPLRIAYRSTSAAATDNRLDISVFDTNGTPVTLSGSSTALASTAWATTQLEFTGTPTWTVGQEFLIKFKLSAKDNYQMHLGGFKLQYRELLQN